jgi:magnesium transporter
MARALSDSFIDSYPQEAMEILEEAPVPDVAQFLRSQPAERVARILTRMSVAQASLAIGAMKPEPLQRVLGIMPPARVAMLMGSLAERDREAVLDVLDETLARELRDLMTYPEGSAGRLMEPRAPSFPARLSVGRALVRLRRFSARDAAILVVTDDGGTLTGLIDLAVVVRADPSQRLAELVETAPLRVHALTPREDIVDLFSRYRLRLLPVVDLDDRLLGVIHQASIIQAAQEEAVTDMQAMVGVSRDERALSTPLVAMRKRLPWLNINLLTAFLAAAVVGIFENTIAQFTALAVLLPVVAGQSGNTGAQALAVIMRGLALREIRVSNWRRILVKELLAGALNGVAIAVVTGLGVLVWSQSPGLAFVIGIAMVISMALAALSGAAIPLLLTRLGQDPAQSASIILTTVTDVVGFFSFLGLATVFSRLL